MLVGFASFNQFSVLYRLVGVGEASFISLAAPFIDDSAPAAQVLDLLFRTIPIFLNLFDLR